MGVSARVGQRVGRAWRAVSADCCRMDALLLFDVLRLIALCVLVGLLLRELK